MYMYIILILQSKDKFSFKSCKFAVQRCKESTGRVVVWRGGVANSFTMEASFCGTNLVRYKYKLVFVHMMYYVCTCM